MTTIAFDGRYLAGDSLAVDNWGLTHHRTDKVIRSKCGKYCVGCSGDLGGIVKWQREIENLALGDVIRYGVPDFDSEKNNMVVMVCYRDDRGRAEAWTTSNGTFFKVTRGFHALGSGRDYALAAMHLGKSADEAVEVASAFDNNTNNIVTVLEV